MEVCLPALDLYRDRGGEVDLILTDLMMPRMDGAALIEAVRKLDPEVPIVAASGRGSEALHAGVAGGKVAGAHRFIPKPYTARRLLATIGEVLERHG